MERSAIRKTANGAARYPACCKRMLMYTAQYLHLYHMLNICSEMADVWPDC